MEPLIPVLVALLLAAGVLALARPELVVPLLLLWLPFEELVLGRLELSDAAFAIARLGGEAVMYAAAAAVVTRRVMLGARLERTALDRPLALILLVALASIAVNAAPLTGSLLNVRAVLRYVVLFYLIVNLRPGAETTRRWQALLYGLAGVQLAVAAAQLVGGDAVRRLFWPRAAAAEVAGQVKLYSLVEKGGREIGSVFGTMSDTVMFASFLVLVLALYVAGRKRATPGTLATCALLLAGILWSFSRAAAFAALLALLLWYAWRRGWGRTIALGAAATAVTLLFAAPSRYVEPERERQGVIRNVTGIFTGDYLDLARKQRLAAVLGNVPTVLANRPLLGYGPDEATTIDRLNASQRSFLLRTWDRAGFEDVYWAALLAYYGVLGLAAFVWLFVRLFRAAGQGLDAGDAEARRLALAVRILVPVTCFLLFFGQFIEYRTYAAYFWAIAAMMVVAARRETAVQPPLEPEPDP